MKRLPSAPKRVSPLAVSAALLVALAGAAWFLVIRDAVMETASPSSDSVAREYGIENYHLAKDGLRHDTVELTPEFQKAKKSCKRRSLKQRTNQP